MEANAQETIRCMHRLLCRRYLIAHFNTLSVQVRSDGRSRKYALHWAFGVLGDGQSEVLGAWLSRMLNDECWKFAFDDLKVRGAESIRFVSTREGPVLNSARLSEVPPRVGRVTQHGDAAVDQLHDCLRRAVRKHGCFADEEGAASFVGATLERAEGRLGDLNLNLKIGRHRAKSARARSTWNAASSASPVPA